MIVVDTNIIVYLMIPGENTESARLLLLKDSVWVAPVLWRSEFRNVLVQYIRHKYFNLNQAEFLLLKSEQLMRDKEYQVISKSIIELAIKSNCSAYDCEYVSLAKELRVPLITTDRQILKAFPDIAIHLNSYLQQK